MIKPEVDSGVMVDGVGIWEGVGEGREWVWGVVVNNNTMSYIVGWLRSVGVGLLKMDGGTGRKGMSRVGTVVGIVVGPFWLVKGQFWAILSHFGHFGHFGRHCAK